MNTWVVTGILFAAITLGITTLSIAIGAGRLVERLQAIAQWQAEQEKEKSLDRQWVDSTAADLRTRVDSTAADLRTRTETVAESTRARHEELSTRVTRLEERSSK